MQLCPYDYIESIEQLENQFSMPEPEAFWNSVTEKGISPEDYTFAVEAFKLLRCRNMAEYLQYYCDVDVILTLGKLIYVTHS